MVDFNTTLAADAYGAASELPLSSNLEDLASSYGAIKQLMPSGGLPILNGYVDPGESYKYTTAVLQNFSAKYMKGQALPQELVSFVASAGGGGGFNLRNSGLMALNSVVSQVTGSDFIDNGVEAVGKIASSFRNMPGGSVFKDSAVQGGVVQITNAISSALADGNVSSDEVSGIAGATCAFAGAAMGAAMGGCAGPIGAAVGMAVGLLISLMQSPPPPPIIISKVAFDRQAVGKQQQYLFDFLSAERKKAVDNIIAMESGYWGEFDKFFATFAQNWANQELSLGMKFGLRWFDDSMGPAFWMYPQDLRLVGARWSVIYNQPLQVPADVNKANFQTFVVGDNAVTRCYLPMCGCPYPDMAGPLTYPKPAGGKVPKVNVQLFSDGEREVRAFAARGLVWVPPEQRLNVDRYVPYPTSNYLLSGEGGIQAYYNMLADKQREVRVKVVTQAAAQVALQLDLARTAGVMRSYMKTMANKAVYRAIGFSLEDANLANYIESRNSMLNNAALMAGLGVLGYAAWRTFK